MNTFAVGFCYAVLAQGIVFMGLEGWLALFLPNLLSSLTVYYPFKNGNILSWFPIDSYDIAAKTRPVLNHGFSILIILFAGILLLALTRDNKAEGETTA